MLGYGGKQNIKINVLMAIRYDPLAGTADKQDKAYKNYGM